MVDHQQRQLNLICEVTSFTFIRSKVHFQVSTFEVSLTVSVSLGLLQ